MAWLTQIEFDYHMDVAVGRYRREPRSSMLRFPPEVLSAAIAALKYDLRLSRNQNTSLPA